MLQLEFILPLALVAYIIVCCNSSLWVRHRNNRHNHPSIEILDGFLNAHHPTTVKTAS